MNPSSSHPDLPSDEAFDVITKRILGKPVMKSFCYVFFIRKFLNLCL